MAKHLIGSTLWSLAIHDTVKALETVSEMGFEAVQFTFAGDADLKPRNLANRKRTKAAQKVRLATMAKGGKPLPSRTATRIKRYVLPQAR